jgi:hypothetical protein
VLAEDDGIVTHVACVVASARRSVLRNAPLVTAIINALPERTQVSLLTNDRLAFQVGYDDTPGRVTFLDLPGDLNLTIWPQDPFLVMRGPDESWLLASAVFPRLDDRAIGEQLAENLGWEWRQSSLVFEGGNVVAGSRHVFVGADVVAVNSARLGLDAVEVARRCQEEFGRPVVVVGPTPQPVEHIDLILTVLDDHRIALADPGRGAQIAREQLRQNPEMVSQFEHECEALFFGDASIRELKGPDGQTLRPPKVRGQATNAVARSEAIASKLDQLARDLTKFGYEVERVPFLQGVLWYRSRWPGLTAIQQSDAHSVAPDHARVPGYPTLTYNNVVTETTPEGRVVFLPQYGWEAMDEAGADAWQKLGYKVVPVGSFAVSALHNGSLRCCVKVLRRQ